MPGISEPPIQEILNLENASVKPRILSCASPVPGHTAPVLRVSEALSKRGYDVTMIAGIEYFDAIKKFGGRPVEIEPMMTAEAMGARAKVPPGPEQLAFDMSTFFIKPTKVRMECVYATLEKMNEEDPESQIVIVTESFFLGTHPMYLGAPLPKGFTKRPRVINLHALAYFVKSVDTGPIGMGLLPDPTPEGREKMAALRHDAMHGEWSHLLDMDEENMRSLGAVNYRRDILWELWQTTHDLTLQMCPPSLEYARPDWHPKVQFVGALPAKPAKADQVYPPFWDEITSGQKRVVVVSQGTIATEYHQLILPTLKGLADRDDLLVVALLGVKGASLPSDIEVPSNVRVLDYFPYDVLLPHASVFVFNAGYGGFIHGAINGVPMVLAGISEEKPEAAARGEYCGVAVNLRTSEPSVQQVTDAINRVLTEPSFKKKAAKVKAENEAMSATDAVESAVLKMAALGYA